MKLIRTFEGMSMNSLKPSINSEPESSLDSCMMKEVDDCIRSKDLHSQNNGDKELCVTDFEIGCVGNTPKKMFEQVDLNSSLPSSEVTHKRDSWNPGPLYDKTSEKENMVEPSEVTYDMLSDDDDDDDDNDSIHLKISSDDENSNLDSEINNLSSSSSKPLFNCEDEISQNATGSIENENVSCTKEDLCPSANTAAESNEEITVENIISDKETESSVPCDGETEAKSTIGSETGHEDTSEEPEPTCSDSPELSLNGNSSSTSETMVNEVKSVPTSPKSFNSKENLEMSDSNLEIGNEESLTNSDKSRLQNCAQEVPQGDCNPQTSPGSDVDPEVTEKYDCSSDEIIPQGQTTDVQTTDDNTNSEDTGCSSSGKEVILLSDDAGDSDNNREMDETVINDNVEKETVSSEEVEEIDCESTEDTHSPNSAEMNDAVKEEKLVTEDCTPNDSLDSVSTVKNSSSEERFLEILEYQPINEETEELKEIHSDKQMSCSEVDLNSSLDEENACELSVPAVLCSDKEIVKSDLPTLKINNSENLDHGPIEIDTILVSYPKSVLKENLECEESVNIVNEIGPSVTKELQKRDSSENEGVSEENYGIGETEKDKFASKNNISMKTELPPENCEAKSSRKRTSNCEENLVNSKRTKVAISESEANEKCDVFVYEHTTEREHKRIAEVDTKEKCDSRAKRLSGSSVTNDVKKIRVMPDPFQVEKDEEMRGDETSVRSVELVKDDERNINSKNESGKSEEVKLNALPFLRSFSRSQLKNLSRNDLEELVLQKICEAITERSHCGELRELAQSLEQKIKAWQKKSLQLTKQVKDLNLVLKRYSTDLQSKGPNAVPVKITRSVGLQVQMPGSSNVNWLQEETTRRKSEKSSPSTPILSTPSSGPASVKTCTPSPTKPASANVPKVSEASDSEGLSGPLRQNPQLNPQAVGGAKVLPSKPPTSLNSVSSSASKSSNKQQSSTANNKPKSSPDLQVIDLTDPEEKTKNCTNRLSTVNSTLTATSVPVPITSTVITSGASSNSVANVGAGCRSIRVVQHLSGSTPILTQTGTNTVAGQRVAYFVPTTSVPVQQRQLIISSSPQIRPAGVMSMSQRQNPLPTILLKPGQVVPVSPAAATGASIIRTTMNNPVQLTSRAQPRSGQLFQRFPTSPVQSSALSVVQSSGLSVSSVSHPAPLPPIPPSVTNNANMKLPPPKPDLKISKVPNNRNQQGIVLSWNMTVTSEYEEIASYQLFAYQEGSAPPSTQLWKKVGDVKALPLPMACTLTQFMEGHKYHFAVRAVDVYARYGPFSAPGNIVLTRN